MTQISPCPFCAAELEHSDALSSKRTRRMIHPRNGCIIEGFALDVSDRADDIDRVERWNRRNPPPVPNVRCPCTTFEQGIHCIVGYPSLLCSACDGTGNAPITKVVALAAEMMKVAEQVDELEDPFAAWESIDLIKSQRDQLRKALVDMLPPDLPWKRDADGVLIHHKVAAINCARAALAPATEGSTDPQKIQREEKYDGIN